MSKAKGNLPWQLWLSPTTPFGGSRPPRDDTLVSLLGFPLDETTSFLPGTRLAPEYVRRVSQSLEWFSYLQNHPLDENLVYDEGDLTPTPGKIEESLGVLSGALLELVSEKRVPLTIGGEHTLTYAALPLLARESDVALVVFDAHADLRDEYLGSRLNHATYLRRIADRVEARRIVLVGSRALSREEYNYAREQGILIIGAQRIWEMGLRDARVTLTRALRDYPRLYVSIDVDALDPAYAPGVGTPEPLGLSPQQVLHILRSLLSEKTLVGMDIVEYNPFADSGYATASLVAKLVMETAGLLQGRTGI